MYVIKEQQINNALLSAAEYMMGKRAGGRVVLTGPAPHAHQHGPQWKIDQQCRVRVEVHPEGFEGEEPWCIEDVTLSRWQWAIKEVCKDLLQGRNPVKGSARKASADETAPLGAKEPPC